MVRVAFTVALLVAVAGVVVPATEYAGVQRGDTAVRDAVERLVSEARALAAGNDALPSDTVPARRAVVLALPTDGFASAGVEHFSLGPPNADGATSASGETSDGSGTDRESTLFTWRVAGGTEHTVVADGVRIRPRGGRPLRLSGGQTRVILRLVDEDGQTVVRVRREG
ncbi:hypothetical protein ACFQMA_06105 [Halosimplex aquaticum]|uniref:DUF7311 domain-containing protein n=1 Tax=Halosimplex aquaticum TaxID=3026162 RepID=A0ABD5XWH4_9EURY|nr:hypothetical protein [Halosimplex aquaticum]